jgi:STE24 endopeptidase
MHHCCEVDQRKGVAMMTRSRERAHRARRFGLWRAVAAGPVMLGSLAVVVLIGGALGQWAAVLPLAWLAVALVWLTAAGERVAVRVAYGYRRTDTARGRALVPAFGVALARSGQTASSFDLYVRAKAGSANSVNAYAAGRRSVAVSAGLVAALARGELTPGQGGALLTHELGHLRIGATRYGLAVAWLTAPWRAVVAVFGGLVRLAVGKVPTARAAWIVLGPIVVAVAVVQGVQQHAWVPLAALVVAALVLALHPLVDAALTRAGERAADAYAVECGAGPDLADALDRLAATAREGGWRDTHPARSERIATLAASRS